MTEENPAWAKLGERPGLCLDCRYAKLNETRRGTAYLRCLRSAWDVRLVRYPRLPVTDCAGFEALDRADSATVRARQSQDPDQPPGRR
jgi:hypothetical protein